MAVFRTLGGYPVARYAEAIARLQTLDYRIAIPGHGEIGEKADLGAFLEFLRALEAAVADGIEQERDLADLQENLQFPAYADWLLYDTRRQMLIAETYAVLTGS